MHPETDTPAPTLAEAFAGLGRAATHAVTDQSRPRVRSTKIGPTPRTRFRVRWIDVIMTLVVCALTGALITLALEILSR